MTLFAAVIFAALCLGYALYGCYSIGDMPQGQERDDAWGYVGFWAFMGAVGVVSALVSWWMMRKE
jgi:hypothetical protein